MNVADYLVSFLAAAGVRHMFGYPGSPLVPLLAALERQSVIQWVLMRHENSAALAASAQARLTGQLSVCVATSGPGSLNFVCGVTDGHMDRVPMLALTGLVSTERQGHWEFQDIDQAAIFAAILNKSTACVHPQQLTALLRNYVGHAEQNQETVHLALPANILSTLIDDEDEMFRLDPTRLPTPLTLMPPQDEALDAVAAELDSHRRIAIVLGRRALGCGAAIESLAEKLDAPIITSLDGKGIIDESHPHAVGVLGIFGFPAVETTKQILQRADVILAFGVDTLKPFLTDGNDVQQRMLIQCEPEFTTVTQEYHRTLTLVGPLNAIIGGLYERLERRIADTTTATLITERREFMAALRDRMSVYDDGTYANPLRFLLQLSRHLDEATTVVLDTGAHTLWAAQFLLLTQRQRVLVSSRMGTMGFSLPAAIAAQLTHPGQKVVTICGDGGFQMVVGELATAVQYQLPIVLIIFNNGVLHNVSAQQSSPFGTELHNPDFVLLARAYGAEGAVIDANTDVHAVLHEAFAPRNTPFLIDLRCDPRIDAPLSKWDQPALPSAIC
jgi:thiamine pyrophosphate-dependent acetolactate synthase large subunit-like protein